jgi:hypothetical protein
MKRLATGISLLIALMLSLLLAPAAAQESTPLAPEMGEDGIESVVSRGWGIDFANASPEASPEIADLQMVMAMVMRFETPEQAATAFELFMSDMSEQMATDDTSDEVELTMIDGIGDQAAVVSSVVVESEGTWISRLSVAQEGRYLYTVTAFGGDADRVASADELLTSMVDANDPADGDGTFMEDGTSTGGLWDVLPTDDHPALAGLISYGDTVQDPEATPES